MRVRRGILAFFTAVAAFGCAAALFSTTALAASTHSFLGAFGSFSKPTGVAVDNANGNVYAVDSGGSTVGVFGAEGGAPAGGAPATLTDSCASAFAFAGEPAGVAVDDSAGIARGDVYVTDVEGAQSLDKFHLNGSGEFECLSQLTGFGEPIGAATDGEGDVYVGDYGHQVVREFTPEGTEVAQFSISGIPRPQGIAVDSNGDMFVQNYGGHQLAEAKRGSPTATTIESTTSIATGVTGVAIDRATNHLFIDFATSISEYELDGERNPVFTLQFGEEHLGNSLGIAVNEASEHIYATDAGSGVVADFGPLVNTPDVSPCEATNVSQSSATLTGTVNPEGSPTTYFFEYGTTTAYGTQTAEESAGGGSVAIATNPVELTGLAPNTVYHCRLVAHSTIGPSNSGDDTFFTAAPPLIEATSSAAATNRSIQLSGTIDPLNSETSYRFQYVPAADYNAAAPDPYAAGNSTPPGSAGSGIGGVAVGPLTVRELRPGTLYDYRILASNAGGTAAGPNETFETAAPVLPAIEPFPATFVGPAEATVQELLFPEESATTYTLEVGTGTSYGTDISGEVEATVEAALLTFNLTNLAPATTYHYRLVARSTVTGRDGTFTTLSYPNQITPPAPPVIVPVPPFLLCQMNQLEENGRCVTPPPACRAGLVAKNGRCVKVTRACRKGFVRKNGRCVKRRPAHKARRSARKG